MPASIPTEIREKFKGLESKYFEKEAVLQFFARLGSSADVLRQIDALLQLGVSVGADGQVCLRDFLEFLYADQGDQISKTPPAPALGLTCGLFAGSNEYVLVKADEILKFKLAGEFQEISKSPVSPWQKIKKDFWEVSRLDTFDDSTLCVSKRIDAAEVMLREEDVPMLVGHEVHAQLTKPQGCDSSLLGTFTDCFVNQGGTARFRLSISKDAGVYVEYDGKSKGSGQYHLLDAFRSRLVDVKRPKKVLWTLRLGGDDYQLLPPPLKVITLSSGQSFDLTHCLHREPAAVLAGPRIGRNGHVMEGDGECIVSFPGKYADCWCLCVEGSLHRTSVACVFLGDKEHGWGQHAENPEEIGKCYCHALYGERGHQQFGFGSSAEYEANGRRPVWGCLWFKRWRDNVELAVSRRQRLVAYFFEGQVGQGLVTWPELCLEETNLWDGQGLGASQKAELAFLQKMGYDFEQRDVRSTLLARSE